MVGWIVVSILCRCAFAYTLLTMFLLPLAWGLLGRYWS